MVLIRCGQCHEWLDAKNAVSWSKETPDVPHDWYFCTAKCMGRFTRFWQGQRGIIEPHGLPSWHKEKKDGTSLPTPKKDSL